MTILELREKRNKAWEAAKAFVETKRDKDGLLSEDDTKTYVEMEQKVQNYTSEIERMQAMEAMEAELNKPVNTPITHKPMNGGYLVPEEYDSRLIDVLTDENIFRSLANVITTSGQHKINIAGAKPVPASLVSYFTICLISLQ